MITPAPDPASSGRLGSVRESRGRNAAIAFGTACLVAACMFTGSASASSQAYFDLAAPAAQGYEFSLYGRVKPGSARAAVAGFGARDDSAVTYYAARKAARATRSRVHARLPGLGRVRRQVRRAQAQGLLRQARSRMQAGVRQPLRGLPRRPGHARRRGLRRGRSEAGDRRIYAVWNQGLSRPPSPACPRNERRPPATRRRKRFSHPAVPARGSPLVRSRRRGRAHLRPRRANASTGSRSCGTPPPRERAGRCDSARN